MRMRVLMVGRSRSIAFEDLKRYWGEVIFARPPRIPLGRYDLVIAQEPTLRVGPAAYLAAKLSGAKFVVEVHGEYLGRWLTRTQRAVSELVLRRADLVRAVNGRIARQLYEMGLRRVVVIPAIYIKTDIFKPMKRHHERSKTIIYAGRLVPEKNLPLLIKAFKLVLREEPSAKLLLIGKGPERGALLRLIESLGIDKNAVLLDRWLSSRELAVYYNEAAVFALTSRYEGGPRAVCEAGACETPFVSTPVGILPEIVRDGVGGFFLRRWDPVELSEKLITLLQDHELRQKMGGEFRRIVTGRFEWGRAVRFYAESYLRFSRDP